MTVRDIIVYPDPILGKVSESVIDFGDSTQQLIADMLETMAEAEGIGLAAIQIGLPFRISVININEPLVLINPSITPLGEKTEINEEGCLSLPGIRADIKRFSHIKIEAKDVQGDDIKLKADGLLGICIQHEVDHMDGKLFINKLSPLAKAKIDGQLRNLLALDQEKKKPNL